MPPLRPQPRFPEPDTEAFWEATKRHELAYQDCNLCSEVVFYPSVPLHQVRHYRPEMERFQG